MIPIPHAITAAAVGLTIAGIVGALDAFNNDVVDGGVASLTGFIAAGASGYGLLQSEKRQRFRRASRAYERATEIVRLLTATRRSPESAISPAVADHLRDIALVLDRTESDLPAPAEVDVGLWVSPTGETLDEIEKRLDQWTTAEADLPDDLAEPSATARSRLYVWLHKARKVPPPRDLLADYLEAMKGLLEFVGRIERETFESRTAVEGDDG